MKDTKCWTIAGTCESSFGRKFEKRQMRAQSQVARRPLCVRSNAGLGAGVKNATRQPIGICTLNTNRRTLLTSATVLAGTGLLGAGTVIGAYSSSIAVANRRVAQNSNLIPTTCGNLEYAMAGKGRPFLMIHGTGGGFDQGLRFAQGLVERGMQVIAPSRFGYLRSSFPDDPSPERQADCLNELLDHLGIDTLPVAGGSAGALIAAQFALHYPQRCSHLIHYNS